MAKEKSYKLRVRKHKAKSKARPVRATVRAKRRNTKGSQTARGGERSRTTQTVDIDVDIVS